MFFRGQAVLKIKLPDKTNKKFVVETSYGDLEFMSPPEGQEAQDLQSWLEESKRSLPGEKAAPPWTMARVILYFRKKRKIHPEGMAAFFCGRFQDELSLGSARRLLKKAFDFFGFWNFLKELKGSGEPGARPILEKIAAEEGKAAPMRLLSGILMVVAGPFMFYVGGFTPTSGPQSLFFIGLAVGGIATFFWGLVRAAGAFMALKRSKRLLA